jgi:hypothetical protein
VFHRKEDHETWPQICRSSIGYFVDKGSSTQARCRGCSKQLPKEELRIKATVTLRGLRQSVVEMSICISNDCIQAAQQKYQTTVRVLEPFD